MFVSYLSMRHAFHDEEGLVRWAGWRTRGDARRLLLAQEADNPYGAVSA
jgi:hypothetical protein